MYVCNCAKVREPSELRFVVVHGVGPVHWCIRWGLRRAMVRGFVVATRTVPKLKLIDRLRATR